jgi:hypothetical protein
MVCGSGGLNGAEKEREERQAQRRPVLVVERREAEVRRKKSTEYYICGV